MFKEIDYQKHFVIGTPLVGWKVDKGEHMSWLDHRLEILEKFPNAKFFMALELDDRGTEPFEQIINDVHDVGGEYWTYAINDME